MARAGGLAQILFTDRRDFLLDKDHAPVKADAVEGKVVGLIIGPHWLPAPLEHAISLIEDPCKELKDRAIAFVYVPVERDDDLIDTIKKYGQTSQLDERPDEECFADVLKNLPDGCLAIPFEDDVTRTKIAKTYKSGIFTLAFVGPDGRLHSDQGLALFEKWGAEGYPFDDDRIAALHKAAQEKRANQNLQVLLVHEERDDLISSETGNKVKVASLTGKTVGLYFSGHWCPPCRKFTPKLKSVYDELKGRGEDFEVIFVSGDRDQESYEEYYGSMPWLALPFNDKSIRSLSRYFDIEVIPRLVIIGPNGKTVTTDGCRLIGLHGADAFPFTDDRIAEVKSTINDKAQNLPKEVTSSKHEHPLTLTDNAGEAENKPAENGHPSEGEGAKPGYVCEGDVCRKV